MERIVMIRSINDTWWRSVKKDTYAVLYTKFVAYMTNLASQLLYLVSTYSAYECDQFIGFKHRSCTVIPGGTTKPVVAGWLLDSCPRNRHGIRPVSLEDQDCRAFMQAQVLPVERIVP
jgi:hypothetical protein